MLAGGPAVRTEGLSKRFGSFVALHPLDLEVRRQECSATSAKGAGKTVTIRLLLGLLRATAGRAEIAGVNIIPPATLVLGVGTLANAIAPRSAVPT